MVLPILLCGLLCMKIWQQHAVSAFSALVPQINIGDVPLNGRPYQIVRVIEYIVPYPYKRSKENMAKTSDATTITADSLEVIPARVEDLLVADEEAIMSTVKPKASKHYLLKLIHRNSVICSGALISFRLMLTSALCFAGSVAKNQKPNAQEYKVQASRSRTYNVVNIVLGPDSTITEILALAVLKAPVQDTLVQPVALCDTQLGRPDNVTMYMSQNHLRFLRTTIIGNAACKRSYAQNESVFITAAMLCARNANRLADCQTGRGDFLLHENTLCGINIYGSQCTEGSINGDLYADVFKVKAQLNRIIQTYA
ncbi:hypothetical protein KR018_011345 [Drosophila ironensis]|nr:hypothetical protein KR018_011345 [Drosophila ironensis]